MKPNPSDARVLVASRFRVPDEQQPEFAQHARAALAVFANCAGYCGGRIGQSTDEPELRLFETTWESIGAYRRALGSYEVKLSVVPFLYLAIDEPSAYEIVHVNDVAGVREYSSSLAADVHSIALGDAASAHVPPVIS